MSFRTYPFRVETDTPDGFNVRYFRYDKREEFRLHLHTLLEESVRVTLSIGGKEYATSVELPETRRVLAPEMVGRRAEALWSQVLETEKAHGRAGT